MAETDTEGNKTKRKGLKSNKCQVEKKNHQLTLTDGGVREHQ